MIQMIQLLMMRKYFEISYCNIKTRDFTGSTSDEYTSFWNNTECDGDFFEVHSTLQAAKAACVNNIECGCIYDWRCYGLHWSLASVSHSPAVIPSNDGSCSWT